MNSNIAAVVVTYNRKELLKKNIAALLGQTVAADIMVIDNNSSDGTYEEIEGLVRSGKLFYYNTGSNLGGAGGFNYGIRKAVELGYKYLWIMDDDTIPDKNALEVFLNKDRELNGIYGFLSSKVLWKDDSLCNMNKQKITKWRYVKDFDKEQQIQYASFVSLFIRSDTVKELGLPYKEFFIWSDDWEYTRRISKKYPGYLIPQSVVHHLCKDNVGADIVTVSPDRLDRFRYMFRNDVVLYRQDGFDGWLYMKLRIAYIRLKIIMKSDNKRTKLKLLSNALNEGREFYPIIDNVNLA